ncbi:MAG: hypothetical protein ACLGIN_08675 [Candidatus Sericytochromatia bacterium]
MDPSLVPSEGVLAPYYGHLARVMAAFEGGPPAGPAPVLAPVVTADENVVAALARLAHVGEDVPRALLADEQAYQHHLVAVHAERLVATAGAPGEAAAEAREEAKRRVALGRRYLGWLHGRLAAG